MTQSSLCQRLADGETALGTMVFEFASTGIGRIAANAGAEFVIYDMEHSGWGIDTIRTLLATTAPTTTAPLVRVPAAQYHLIAGVLDIGARGVMVPMVETFDQAKTLASAVRYPPQGRRGCAFGFAHDNYTPGDILATLERANADILAIAQIETTTGVENVEAIAAVEGIDVLWIGHFDLSVSLGIPGQFDHPTYQHAVQRVLAACDQHGKTPGIMASHTGSATAALAQGFRAIAYGGDIGLYSRALNEGLSSLRKNSSS